MTSRSDHFHARYKILNLFWMALVKAKIPGLTIKKGQVYPLMKGDLPFASVNMSSETASYVSFESLEADLNLIIFVYVQKTSGAEEDMAWFSSKVQIALLTDDKLLKSTNLIVPSGFDLEFDVEGERPVFVGRLTFTATYTIIPTEPFNLEEKQ